MLARLRPVHAEDEEADEVEVEEVARDGHHVGTTQRPQFVLGPEVDEEEDRVAVGNKDNQRSPVQGRSSLEGKGWKEVA